MTNRLGLVPVIFLVGALASRGAYPSTNVPDASMPPPATPLESTTTPASTAAPSPATATDGALATERPTTYTVVSGDTLWDLSHKFNCSVSSLKKLNKLKKNHLKLGQVLKIPPARTTTAKPTTSTAHQSKDKIAKAAKSTSQDKATASDETVPAATPSAKPFAKISKTAKAAALVLADLNASLTGKSKKHRHAKTVAAQPVQDFDIPASNFASCPTPPSNDSDSSTSDDIAPPLETKGPSGRLSLPPEAGVPPVAETHLDEAALPPPVTPPTAKSTLTRGGVVAVPATPKAQPAQRSFASTIADFFGGTHNESTESGEWGNRFLTETHSLADRGIGYNQSWRPEGESHSWVMDCSNTTRYLYQVTAGIQLPRTASDQYYYLHLQNKAWDVPTVSSGFADCNFLRSNLKPGDLLFWENTYRPDRQPPITHVMIFLGANAKGQWIMAGSQSSHGGEFNPHRNGPDVYVFNPTRPSGGYTTWLGLVHHQGRFCAYGRPLEADVKKLSVATND